MKGFSFFVLLLALLLWGAGIAPVRAQGLVCPGSEVIDAGTIRPETWGFQSGQGVYTSCVWTELRGELALGALSFGFFVGPARGLFEDMELGELHVETLRTISTGSEATRVSTLVLTPKFSGGKKPAILPLARFRSLFVSEGVPLSDTLSVLMALEEEGWPARIVSKAVCLGRVANSGGAVCDIIPGKGLLGSDIADLWLRGSKGGIAYDVDGNVVGFVRGLFITRPCGRTAFEIMDIALLLTELDVRVAVERVDGELPTEFALQGNYPNPFNPSTTIQIDLPETAEVTVEIIDMLGRNVMTLPVKRLEAGAARSIDVNATNLASGTYLYRVIARTATDTMVKTGRMMLIK